MSMKPDDIPQWAWYKAESAFWNNQSCTFNASGFSDDVVSVMARAIMSAVEEERGNRTMEKNDENAERDFFEGRVSVWRYHNPWGDVYEHVCERKEGKWKTVELRIGHEVLVPKHKQPNPKTDKTDNERPQE